MDRFSALISDIGDLLAVYWKSYLINLGNTLLLALVATAIGCLLGLICGILNTIPYTKNDPLPKRFLLKLIRIIVRVYVEVFRGTPMVLQAVFVYYGLPYFTDGGLRFDNIWAAAILVVSINTGAYMAEIIRGGIVSVDKGQFEAAHAIGMTHWQTMTTVVLPQAIRNILPSVGNELIVNIKDSSVLNVISVSELFFQAKSAAGTYYRYFEVYFIIAVIYLILTLSVSAILRAVEKKMDGPDNYVIHGSQSDSRADIKVSVENEKEAVKRWNA